MNRKPFAPQAGTSYRNQGGGNFACIAATEEKDVFIMQNKASGWTFNAHGVGIYDDDSIDWNYSTDGHFESVSGQQTPPRPQDVLRNAVQTWDKETQCDTCVHKYMYRGDIEACRRRDKELDCQYEEQEVRICPVCEKEVYRDEMNYTKDCHGIPFRLVCWECYLKLMEKGYDGEYYDESDEQIEDDY